MPNNLAFDELSSSANDPAELFRVVGRQLVDAGEFHRLFDLRLVQRRHELGLSPEPHASIDDLDEQVATKLEQGYLDACREIGQLFLQAGQPLVAWRYLRPTGEKQSLRRWLSSVVPNEENADELIELALHEGIDPERGYAWLLASRGTCQGITELEGMQGHLPIDQQAACATVLVRQLHKELSANLRGHLEQLGQQADDHLSVQQLLATWPQLTAEAHFHVDTSHLSTTVRFARLLTEPSILEKAIELADYGAQLAEDYQYPDQPPFEELYPTHGMFFRATLGQDVDQAVEYFGGRARENSEDQSSTAEIETYLILLDRSGRYVQALEEYASLVPEDCELSPYAPNPLALARKGNCWSQYLELCQSRDDIVGFAAGKLHEQRDQ